MIWIRAFGGLALGFLIGAVPFSYLIARQLRGVDLRTVGSHSTSPSNLYRVAGFRLAALGGVLEVVKGIVGPLVAPHNIPLAVAGAGGLAVAAHNWPPLLRGGGGRGLSTATGALTVLAWPAGLVMLGGLIVGAPLRRVYPAISAALVVLIPVMWILRGPWIALCAGIIVLPVGWKTAAAIRQRRIAAASREPEEPAAAAG